MVKQEGKAELHSRRWEDNIRSSFDFIHKIQITGALRPDVI